MIDEAESGAWEGGFCGGKFVAEVTEDMILVGRRERMEAEGNGIG